MDFQKLVDLYAQAADQARRNAIEAVFLRAILKETEGCHQLNIPAIRSQVDKLVSEYFY